MEQLPIPGPWSLCQGEYEGNVMILRVHSGYRGFVPLPGYDHQAGIAVPFREPAPSGLPSIGESPDLAAIEESISQFEENAESLLVAVITTGGMREFVLYTRSPADLERRFELLSTEVTSHEMQLMIQPDENWETYAQFAQSLAPELLN